MGVSSSTVVEAYDRLTVEGGSPGTSWIRFLCSKRIGEALTLNLMEEATLQSRNVDSFRVSRLSLDASSLTLNPGCGWLPSSWMPVEVVRRGLRTLVRENKEILSGYGTRVKAIGCSAGNCCNEGMKQDKTEKWLLKAVEKSLLVLTQENTVRRIAVVAFPSKTIWDQ